MKNLFVLIIALGICGKLSAQKAELSLMANGGLFHYTGASAEKQSYINSPGTDLAYTNNPYGNKNAFSYGGALQLKLIGRSGFIAGLETGYDVLRSKVDIVQPISTSFVPALSIINTSSATGATFLQSSFINISPFVGYRLLQNKYTLDILPGIDIALGLNSHEHGKVQYQGVDKPFTTNVDRHKPPTDVRLRLGLAAGYQKFGLSVSYASGKSNYLSGMVGGRPEAYSALLRFGVSYRIF